MFFFMSLSEVALTIIDSDHWTDALKNKNPGKKKDYYLTPLRKLIRKMPGMCVHNYIINLTKTKEFNCLAI